MNAQDLISRARTMQGRKTVYWPGTGGHDPAQPLSSDWALGLAWQQPASWTTLDGWINTDSIWQDAHCSADNFKSGGDTIAETESAPFAFAGLTSPLSTVGQVDSLCVVPAAGFGWRRQINLSFEANRSRSSS